jgi:hypothetical protein
MKKIIALIIGVTAFFVVSAQDMTEVLKNHYETIGMDKIRQVNNIVTKGNIVMMGTEMPYVITITRSGKLYLEVPIQGMLMKRGFDGTVAWMSAPWTGSSDPIELGDFEKKMIRTQVDIDGMLYEPESKGYKAEFLGKEDMEGSPVYLIKLSDTTGDEYTQYIDAENFVVLKIKGSINYQGSKIETETFYSNYKPVDGIIMPFSMESKMNGQTQSQIVVTEYLFDQEINDSIFMKPEPQPKTEPEPAPDK